MTAKRSVGDRIPVLNLRRLHYFLVLAEELHFGRAAARLNLAQPGLSQQIRALESEVGVVLIDRRGRDTCLTPAGELLREEAILLVDRSEEILEAVRARGAGATGTLRIAYTRSATLVGTTEMVQEFRSRYPDIRVTTTVAWTAYNLEQLRADRVDVAFVRPPVDDATIETLQVAVEDLVVALPSDHRLADWERIGSGDLRDEPIILWPRDLGPGYYDSLVAQIWTDGAPRIVVEEPDNDQILAAVGNGTGISVVERHRAARSCPPGVVIRPFTEPVPRCGVALAWRRDRLTPTARVFIASCQAAVGPS